MTAIDRASAGVLLSLLVLGCGPTSNDSASTTTSTSTTTATDPTTTTSTSTANSTTLAPTTSDTAGFVAMPDLPTPGEACDPWQDTCPAGQKCKPYAEGFGPWIGASCVPVADPSTPTGGACEAAELSFTDECEGGAVCHGFLGDEESRRCHEICGGSLAQPTCSAACSRCVSNGGFAGVCLFPCDPRASDCPPGQTCQVLVEAPRLLCGVGPGPSTAGEVCESPGWCTEGTACADAALVPGCADAKCCTPVCDLDAPDTCAQTLPGTTCSPWPANTPDFEASCLPAGLGLCTAA